MAAGRASQPLGSLPLRRKVLLVGDDRSALGHAAERLTRAGAEVDAAFGSDEALEAAERTRHDVAVLDLTALGDKAVDLIHMLKNVRPGLRMITISDPDRIALSIRCMKLGVFDDITAPLDPEVFLSRVRAACGAKKVHIKKRRKLMEKFKVLLVDDEKEFVKSLAERLQLREMDSDLAFDGEQALQLVSDEKPDVMVLDLRMPGIDGLEVLRRVKTKYPDVQVVILTGHGGDKDRVEAEKLGAFAYLQKPVDLDGLVKVLKKAYKNKVESSMTAAVFAEAGDFDTARRIMKDADD